VKSIRCDLSLDPYEITKKILEEVEELDISVVFLNAGYGVVEVSYLLYFESECLISI
jgi:hypothetical protein